MIAAAAIPVERRLRRIGIIGGVDRTMVLIARAAATIDCAIEHHDGHMTHLAVAELTALIDRVDLLVVLTDVNSHTAVIKARRIAAARGRPYVLARRMSPGRFVQLIAERERALS